MRKEDVKLIDFTALGINTKLFSPAATYYDTHGNYPDFKDTIYWDEEERRCIEGYSITSTKGVTISITGEHYSYLNYTRIKLTDDPDAKSKKSFFKRATTKKEAFPDFWDGDYIFYWCKIIARYGASNYPEIKKQGGITLEEFTNLHFPDEVKIKKQSFFVNGIEQDYFEEDGIKYYLYGSGKNVVVGKKRRGGYSYKMGNAGSRRYHFFKKSTTLLTAYDNAYLLDDALMTKTVECIDWIDSKTPFTKRRLINLDDHKMCGYKENVGGVEVHKGRKSQIIAISFRGNKGAARGKDADEIYVEESGKAPNLIEFSDATIDSLSDGLMNSTGQIIWFGTGGGDNTDWEGFKEIFYNPNKYNCLEFENVWDEGATGTYCGMFIPDYWTAVGFITPNGESLIELAKEAELEYQKNKYLTKGDGKGLVARKMEHPMCPAEAFAISSSNIFDVLTVREWRLKVEREKLHQKFATVGSFSYDSSGKLKFNVDDTGTLQPFWDYPINENTPNKKGAVVIWNPPLKEGGQVPANRYIIDVDTYRYDQSTGSSVGAAYVKILSGAKVPFNLDNRIVGQYVGRPAKKDDFCRIIFQLADYYNAKIGYENDDQTLLDYAKAKKLDLMKYFEGEFQLAFDEKIATKNSKVRRKFGMHIGDGKLSQRKYTGDEYIKDSIEEVRGTYEDGSTQTNLMTIYDIGLLKEIESYNPEKGNFDRIAALRIQAYHEREIVYENRKETVKRKTFFLDNHQCFK